MLPCIPVSASSRVVPVHELADENGRLIFKYDPPVPLLVIVNLMIAVTKFPILVYLAAWTVYDVIVPDPAVKTKLHVPSL